jgi:hypothetical protein
MSRQSSSSTDYSGHPLVGSWFVDIWPDDPDQPPQLVRLSTDGGVVITAVGGLSGVGVWSPAGERSGTVTFSVWLPQGKRLLVRARADVALDGDSFSGPYTNEFFPPTGESTGEIGPSMATATRMAVEAPGTPVASLEEFSGVAQTPPDERPES